MHSLKINVWKNNNIFQALILPSRYVINAIRRRPATWRLTEKECKNSGQTYPDILTPYSIQTAPLSVLDFHQILRFTLADFT